MSEFVGALSREQMLDCIEQAKNEELFRRSLRVVPLSLKELKAGKYEFRMQETLLMNFLASERRSRLKKGTELGLFEKPLRILKAEENEDDWLNDDLNRNEWQKDELERYAEKLRNDTQEADKLREKLLGWVFRTRNGERYSIGGRNAITILNYSRYCFSGLNLSGIHTPNSDFSDGAFDYTVFRKSNISGSRIDGSFRFVDFGEANIEGIQHGIYERKYNDSIRSFDQDVLNNKIVHVLPNPNGFWITVQDLLGDEIICRIAIQSVKKIISAINMTNGTPEDVQYVINNMNFINIAMTDDVAVSSRAVILSYDDGYILFVIDTLALVKYDMRLDEYSILHKGHVTCLVRAGVTNQFIFNNMNHIILVTIANKLADCKFEKFKPLHRHLITHLAFDSNKSYIAATSREDTAVTVWSLQDKCLLGELNLTVNRYGKTTELLQPWVSCFDPTGSRIAVSFGECIALWNTDSFTYIGSISEQVFAARKMTWGSTGSVIFYADWYGNLYSLAIENSGIGKNQKLLLNLGENISQITHVPSLSGVILSVTCYDHTLRLINFDFLENRRVEGPKSLVIDLIVVNNFYYVAHYSGEICKYNLNTGAIMQIYLNFIGLMIRKLISTNDGEILVCYFESDEIVFRNLSNLIEKHRISHRGPTDFKPCGYKIAINPLRIMIGSCDGNVHYISRITHKLLHAYPKHAHSFSFSENGKYVATGSGTENDEVVIFNIESELVYSRFKIKGMVSQGCCEFSKDSRFLAVISTDKKLYLFDVLRKSVKYMDIALWGRGGAESIAIYSGKELVIAIGFTESICIWNISMNKQIEFNGHLSEVSFMNFINPNTFLAVDRTGARKLWKIEVTVDGNLRVLLNWGYNQLFCSKDIGDEAKSKIKFEQMKMISRSLPFFSKNNLEKKENPIETQSYQYK